MNVAHAAACIALFLLVQATSGNRLRENERALVVVDSDAQCTGDCAAADNTREAPNAVAKQDAVPEFVPTHEWKDILPNQALPPVCLYIALSMSHGRIALLMSSYLNVSSRHRLSMILCLVGSLHPHQHGDREERSQVARLKARLLFNWCGWPSHHTSERHTVSTRYASMLASSIKIEPRLLHFRYTKWTEVSSRRKRVCIKLVLSLCHAAITRKSTHSFPYMPQENGALQKLSASSACRFSPSWNVFRRSSEGCSSVLRKAAIMWKPRIFLHLRN